MMNFKTFSFKSIMIAGLLLCTWQIDAQTFYNTFDRAQPTGRGVWEVSGNYARQIVSFNGEQEAVANTFGLRAGYGITNNFDLKLSWTNFDLIGGFFDDIRFNFLSIKPKYSFNNTKFAVALPIGIIFATVNNDTESETYIAPELMFNYPINEHIEIGANTRYIAFFEDDSDNLIGVNLAVGVSKDLNRWVAKPEFGIVFDPDNSDIIYLTPGIAFSYFIGSGRKASE